MSKKAELFAIQSSKGFIKSSGVQNGVFTPDLAEAKLYDSELKASNMMKGWSKVKEWDDVNCWVAKIEVAVVGKAESAEEKPASIKKKSKAKKAAKKTPAKKAKAKKRA